MAALKRVKIKIELTTLNSGLLLITKGKVLFFEENIILDSLIHLKGSF